MTRFRCLLLCSAAAFGCIAFPAGAQETVSAEAKEADAAEVDADDDDDDADNDAVIVTATRSAKAIDKIPGAVSVITAKELAQQYQIADDPAAALAATVPGFAPSRQKLSSAGETLRGRGALIMLDNIPQGNPLRDGRREGYFIDSAVIGRIEVVSGASAIHGLGATGGIINYITRSAEEGTHHKLDLRTATQFRYDNLDFKAGYTFTHKSDAFDIVAYAATQRRGMLYDARGDLIGVSPGVGDTMDTRGNNVFLKLGKTFGPHRIQASVNRFRIYGEADYLSVDGNALADIPTTSVRGVYAAGVAPYNKMLSTNLTYTHDDLLGGNAQIQLFTHSSDVLFGPDVAPAFQDRNIAPVGTLYDQGLLTDRKKGAKLTYVRPDTLINGLELTVGADQIFDETEQVMALTDRVWMPLLKYQSTAPFMQLEFDSGDFTVRGGVRYESGKLKVPDFQTLGFYGRLNNNWIGHTVEGGTRKFSKLVKSLGGVWRFAPGFSAFAGYSEGFGLPDVGILLRATMVPNQSVENLVSLSPIVTKSKEVGLNWRNSWGSFGVSAYESKSRLGSALRIGADGKGEVVRVPTRVRGIEALAEVRPVRGLALYATYALTDGKTALVEGYPLDLSLGGRSQGPNKLTGAIDWNFMPRANARLQATHLFDRDINIGRGRTLEEHFNGYTVADFSASYQTGEGSKIGLGIENIFNKHYIVYFSQIVRASAADANGQYVAGHGRVYSLSFSQEF